MSRITFLTFTVLAFGVLAGCSTFQGVGEDISAVGKKLHGDREPATKQERFQQRQQQRLDSTGPDFGDY